MMLVRSQNREVVLNIEKVAMYWIEGKTIRVLVNEDEFAIGRYSTKEKCKEALRMLTDCHNMNRLFEHGGTPNPRELFDDYVSDQQLGIFDMPQEDEVYESGAD